MAAQKNRRRSEDAFEDRFFNQLDDRLDRIEDNFARSNDKLDKRLKIVENAVLLQPVTKVDNLPAWYRDPTILSILRWLTLALLIALSALYGFDLTGVL